MKKLLFAGAAAAISSIFTGCAPSTSEIAAVSGFDPDSYMGEWFEIARLPHSFERDLDYVRARYTRLPDGSIRVVNSGSRNGQPRQITGKAKLKYPHRTPLPAELRVSFFGPFYSDYRIIELPPDRSYAVVTGSRKNYLWILARRPVLPPDLLRDILDRLAARGFDTGKLEYPRQRSE